MTEPDYEAEVVAAFIEAHATRREDGRLDTFNAQRLRDSHHEMLARWATWDKVPLWKLDRFLIQYDLMLFEFDMWALEHCGRTGLLLEEVA